MARNSCNNCACAASQVWRNSDDVLDEPVPKLRMASARSGSIFSTGVVEGASYRPDRPVIPLDMQPFAATELGERLLLQKGPFWSYEEEYRWIRYPHPLDGLPLIFRGQCASFPADLLCGLTLGARMKEWEVQELVRIAMRYSPPLPVWVATYDLGFEQIA